MTETIHTLSDIKPLAMPSDADLAGWQALSRNEQLRRLQEKLTHRDCATVSSATMSDVLKQAQAKAKPRHG